MTSASTSDPRSSLRTRAKPNSDAIIYGDLEGFHAIGDSETMPSDSAMRTRKNSTGKHRERSSFRLDTSERSESSLRTKSKTEESRRRSISAIATTTAGLFEMTMSKSATEIISSPADLSEKKMRKRGSSEKRMSMSASEIIIDTAGSPEKTTSSSESSDKKTPPRLSSDFITNTAGSSRKELRTLTSKIIPSTAGSSQKKKKSSSGSPEKKVIKVSSDLITGTVGVSEKKMSMPASDVVTSTAGSSEKRMSRAASEIITTTAGSSKKTMARSASEIMTCTDGAFGKTRSRSTSKIITSTAGSSERTKSSSAATERKKKKSASEKVKSRTESSEKKKKKKSKTIDPLGASLRSSSNSISKRDRLDSAHKEKMRRKPTIEVGEEPQETATLTAKEKTDDIPVMDSRDVGAWFFENASWFNDEEVAEPSLQYLESQRQKKQVVDVSKASTQQHRKTRRNTISHESVDFLVPKLTDTPMSGISMDDLNWEERSFKKSCLDLGACAPTNDAHKTSDSAIGEIATGGIPTPQAITAKTDVKMRQYLEAFKELDRKLTSLLSLETRRRLRKVDKPRPTLDELIIPQGGDTPMSGLSMDGTELLDGQVKESFLNLGASATSFDEDDNSFAIDQVEAPEVRCADEEKKSQGKHSLGHSASCDEVMSLSDENENLRRRRTLRRSDICQETVGSKPAAMTFTDAKDCKSDEIPIRDSAGNKVRLRKTATERREGRNPSSQCLDETRHSRQSDNDKQLKTRHKEKSSKPVQYYFDLHIPRRCDPPLSGISMSDLEWVEDLYSTLDVHPGLTHDAGARSVK